MSERCLTFPYKRVRPFLRTSLFLALSFLSLSFYAALFFLGKVIFLWGDDTFRENIFRTLSAGFGTILAAISCICFLWLDTRAEQCLNPRNPAPLNPSSSDDDVTEPEAV